MHLSARSSLALTAIVAVTGLFGVSSMTRAGEPSVTTARVSQAERIAPWRARFGRSRPVIAVIGENSGTELTDFVIPYGVLTQSGVADTFTVATRTGLLKMRPALKVQPQATIATFDARFPQGADYVIVPAVVKRDEPVLLAWIAAQGAKGSTIVSICDGALVVANSGLMKGHRATAHWATEGLRAKQYPDTHWVKNVRYVADGNIVSSAGISAAIPTSLALVEAIAGHARAAALAQQLGVAEWGSQHDSDRFHPHFGRNLNAFVATMVLNPHLHGMQHVGVPITAGVDEIALALTADAYSRTGRSHALSLAASAAPITTRNGLVVVPDVVIGGSQAVDQVLPAFDATPPARVFDQALAAIAVRYGRSTAYGVAMDFEYPGFRN